MPNWERRNSPCDGSLVISGMRSNACPGYIPYLRAPKVPPIHRQFSLSLNLPYLIYHTYVLLVSVTRGLDVCIRCVFPGMNIEAGRRGWERPRREMRWEQVD